MSTQAKYSVYHSTILDASAADAWKVVRDIVPLLTIVFGDGVKDAHWINGGSGDHVPAKVQFTLMPGDNLITEEVVARDEVERSLTYRTVGQALNLYDYVATYRVLPVTNVRHTSFMEWSREFKVVDGADPDFLPTVLQMFKQETDTVQTYFAKGH